MPDLLVAGGGLVGSYVAHRLARMGHRVLVLERKKHLEGKQVCTGIVGRECAEIFAIAKKFILREARAARLFSPSGKELYVWRPETQAYILDRAALDVSLAEQAQSAGAEYVMDCPVQRVEIKPDGVEVRAVHGGNERKFTAAAALVACGFASSLTESLGLGALGDSVAGAQAEVSAPGADDVELYSGNEVAPGFFAWLVPTVPGRARVGLLSRRNPGLYLQKLLQTLSEQGKVAAAGAEIQHGVIPLKPLVHTYAERVLVAGDAAGQVKPTTGGGIYYGLLCAELTVTTLHEALESGDLSARKLAGYQHRWHHKLKRELTVGYRARKLFETLSDKNLDRIFDIIKENGIEKELARARELSFDWHGKTLLRLFGYSMIRGALGKLYRGTEIDLESH
ncbi:MAG: NAD(P)/FAD-dependent oxidoreductase [Dehalococcoidales bacterium]|nr:NAD(P)/FAD-dependent oxidoreductase [Dehalococcoidales bacterium]